MNYTTSLRDYNQVVLDTWDLEVPIQFRIRVHGMVELLGCLLQRCIDIQVLFYLREIIRPPFRIVYKLDADRVQITLIRPRLLGFADAHPNLRVAVLRRHSTVLYCLCPYRVTGVAPRFVVAVVAL